MQNELIQFGVVAASRARRSAAGFSQPIRATQLDRTTKSAIVLDQAFADFTRVDAAETANAGVNRISQETSPALTETLLASIATQLEALDSQRRQLERLLNSAGTNATP